MMVKVTDIYRHVSLGSLAALGEQARAVNCSREQP